MAELWSGLFWAAVVFVSGFFAGYQRGKNVGLDREIEDFNRRLDEIEAQD